MIRCLHIFIALIAMTGLFATTQAHASKHAVLIYDADTKRVLYHENGYDKRYPASLTKMMTLYMLFEQLRAGQISTGTRMKASAHAASQPQTNISLRAGDTITVDQAIRALVVRSANDVAVVIAEHLAGSEKRFARATTQKARQLGMRHTTFKNPHGLPNSGQVTTAIDMAILGAALRRDFPQYYGYFTAKTFSFKGKHFKSHNKVLDKLPGIDGIKTGYIRASGFNLVSSMKTRHSNVVAVVLGGGSSKERDARMVSLLRVTENKLAGKRGGGTYALASAPVPLNKPASSKPLPSEALDILLSTKNKKTIIANIPTPVRKPIYQQNTFAAATPQDTDKLQQLLSTVENTIPLPKTKPSFSLALTDSNADSRANISLSLDALKKKTATTTKTMPRKNTLDYQLAALSKEFPVPAHIFNNEQIEPGKDWAIQVGVFKDTLSARRALSQAARKARKELQHAIADVEYSENGNRGFHRARLKNLSQTAARGVCSKLIAMNQDCFVIKM